MVLFDHRDEAGKSKASASSPEKLFKSQGFGSLAPEFFSSSKKKLASSANLLIISNSKAGFNEERDEIALGSSSKVQSAAKLMQTLPTEADQLLVITPKKMTFLQVDELVNELIETKLQSDVNHLSNRLPKKTMEGHLNEVFMNKFGVRKVVLENIQSFIYHLKYYAYRNSKFKTFSHIMRNECEEEFMQAHRSVEKTLAFLLKVLQA